MISIVNAKSIVSQAITLNKIIELPIEHCTGYVLAENITAKVSSPPFNQSAMDGYCINYSDYEKGQTIKIVDEIQAGNKTSPMLSTGNAFRIFTGAKVPVGADTAVQQENIEEKESVLHFKEKVIQGSNIRQEGSQFKKGEELISNGCKINPATISLMAMAGYRNIKVFKKPSVLIVVTGNELTEPGNKLSGSQIYESNSFMLYSALKQIGIENISHQRLTDDLESTKKILSENYQVYDVIIFTGGISVGKYDFVYDAMKECGVEELFYKVYQKPGKPLYMGKKEDCFLFGLPGNPGASFTCFYEYIYPILNKFAGEKEIYLPTQKAIITAAYKKTNRLGMFLKGEVTNGEVTVMEGQESFKMSGYKDANCIIYLEQEKEIIEKGDTVEVHLLPY